jgi:hypothetical protein
MRLSQVEDPLRQPVELIAQTNRGTDAHAHHHQRQRQRQRHPRRPSAIAQTIQLDRKAAA